MRLRSSSGFEEVDLPPRLIVRASRGAFAREVAPSASDVAAPSPCAFAERRGAAGAEEFVQFAVRQDEEEAFAHRLGALALGAVKLSCGEVAELLAHAAEAYGSVAAGGGCGVTGPFASQLRP